MKAEPYQFLSKGDARVYDYGSIEAVEIDALEAELVQLPQANQQIVMRFAPGVVSRECFTPKCDDPKKTVIATSRIHRTDHFWHLDIGTCAVWVAGTGWQVLNAPQSAVTPKGTRRIIAILEDTMVTTYHANPGNITDPAELDAYLYEPGYGPQRHAGRLLKP